MGLLLACAAALAPSVARASFCGDYPAQCYRGLPLDTTRYWDFESGTLSGWTAVDSPVASTDGVNAFSTQPTYGDNVSAARQVGGTAWQVARDNAVAHIGGDFWQNPYPVNHRGRYWLGTYESRQTPSAPWGSVQQDGRTGRLVSGTFVLSRDYVHLRVGGGCDSGTVGVRLEIETPNPLGGGTLWLTGTDNSGNKLRVTGECNEMLRRVTWNVSHYSALGLNARFVIYDDSTGGWGHINADDLWVTDRTAAQLSDEPPRVWGFADTHAHPATHLAFRSLGGTEHDGYLIHGKPGLGLATANPGSDLASCDGSGHLTDQEAGRSIIQRLEGTSLGFNNTSLEYHNGGGYESGLRGWPYWWTRAHQQMHVTWLRRAYDGGQRLLVASVTNNELLSFFMNEGSDHGYMSDYGAMRQFAAFMKSYAAANSGWMAIARSPGEARSIIQSGRLAIILAAEVDNLGHYCPGNLTETTAALDSAYAKSTCSNCNPWPVVSDTTSAQRCSQGDTGGWERRVQSLFALGYRLITPIHLADNTLGGTAVYSDLMNVSNRYLRNAQWMVTPSPDVDQALSESSFKPAWCEGPPCLDASGDMGLFFLVPFGLAWDASTPVVQSVTLPGYATPSGFGHVNMAGLSSAGETVLSQMKRRGMLIDVTHMSQLSRDTVLGLRGKESTSIVNPGCDMSLASCQRSAYPVLASHAPAREIARPGQHNEGGLRLEEIDRIRNIGGLVAPGTGGQKDFQSVNAVLAAPDSTPMYLSGVANDCAGSSKSWAQHFLYAVRAMQGHSVALSTDLNGLESQPNPRYSGTGCHAAGNELRLRQFDHMGFLSFNVSADFFPLNFDQAAVTSRGALGTAPGQRSAQYTSSKALNYTHYNGASPTAPRFSTYFPPAGYVNAIKTLGRVDHLSLAASDETFQLGPLSTLPPIQPSVTGLRTFDLNSDGLAHYGMIPDFLQDLRTVGVTHEQLGVLYQSAEDLIQTWEKSCRMSDPAVSTAGCD